MTRKPADDIKAAGRRKRSTHRRPDALDLYEACVTDGPRLARFLSAVHGHDARILREDFAGSGALARAWAEAAPTHEAIAVDTDAMPLARCAERADESALGSRVTTVQQDALRCRRRADIIAATNFPIGYLHQRDRLLRYLRGIRVSLNPRGVFVCDTYGGPRAFDRLVTRRKALTRDGRRVHYTWEQREADPATARVLDTLSFELAPGRSRGESSRPQRFPDAFIYAWRLWSLPELRDAMREAGFNRVEIYTRLGDAVDHEGRLYVRPVGPAEVDPDLTDGDWVAYVAAFRSP